MSVFSHVDGLGAVVENCVADSVLAWRREFKPGNKTVDTLAEHLVEVSTQISLRPAGVAMVTVHVKGRGFSQDAMQCFRLQRKKMGSWKISATSLKDK